MKYDFEFHDFVCKTHGDQCDLTLTEFIDVVQHRFAQQELLGLVAHMQSSHNEQQTALEVLECVANRLGEIKTFLAPHEVQSAVTPTTHSDESEGE